MNTLFISYGSMPHGLQMGRITCLGPMKQKSAHWLVFVRLVDACGEGGSASGVPEGRSCGNLFAALFTTGISPVVFFAQRRT